MSNNRVIPVCPQMSNSSRTMKTKIELSHRIWWKLIISALIPLMIGVFTVVTTVLQQKSSLQQREQDKDDARQLRFQADQHAEDLQRETILTNYLNDVSQLLMLENQEKTLIHIRTRTLTSLRQLDAERKKFLFLFLYESELIYRHSQQLTSTLLKLNGANFNGLQFEGQIEDPCSFQRLHLHDVYFSNCSFKKCFVDRSNFSLSTMHKTIFHNSIVLRSSFQAAFLDNGAFLRTRLSIINFSGASLVQTDFTGSTWENNSVDFTNSNLTGAILTREQLMNSTLINCILPNGSWSSIEKTNLIPNGDLQQNCSSENGTTLSRWNVSNDGEIKVYPSNNFNGTEEWNHCYFRVVSFNTSRKLPHVSQTIDLDNFTLLISSGTAYYTVLTSLQCFGKQYATITLRFIDINGIRGRDISLSFDKFVQESQGGNHSQLLKLSNTIPLDTRAVLISLTFINILDKIEDTTMHEDYCACHGVKFFITNGF